MKFYGYRYEPLTCRVYVYDGEKNLGNLPKRLNEVNHSPTGFEWGYGGSGPAQLAYAILRAIYPKEIAQRYYQSFKWDYVAKFPKAGFVLKEEEIKNWMERNNHEEQ